MSTTGTFGPTTINAQNVNATSGTATPGSSQQIGLPFGYTALGIQLITNTLTAALTVQVSEDGANWVSLAATGAVTNMGSGTAAATIPAGATGIFRVNVAGVQFARVTCLAAPGGAASLVLEADTGHL